LLEEAAMRADEVKSTEDVKRIVKARNPSHIKVGVFDVDGVLRGKYMSQKKFLSALEGGFGFCDVVLGWDSNDQLYDNVTFTGWHTAYPDAPVRLIPESCRELPLEGDGLFFLGEFTDPADSVCARGTLRRVLDRAMGMGLFPKAAFEYEFFLFEETPDTAREKGYRNLKPITPGNFGYSVLRSSVWSEFHKDLLELCEEMRFPLEGLHTETGPGVLEGAIEVTDALEAADRAGLFKTFTKVLAQRSGMLATFMAKWSNDYPGQSGHIHMSLVDENGKSVFYDADAEHSMTDTMRHFVAGQQQLMPVFLSMISPTVNSFSRLVPGFWAPTNATWGVENRTTALRVIPGSAKSQRVEYRIAAADAHPHIALAAAIGSGLYGIEKKLELGEVTIGNAYDPARARGADLPATLWEAAQALKESEVARDLFGDAFVEHFAATREWEEREFRKHITDWEMQRYFEII
jgi:glutamine synthetase